MEKIFIFKNIYRKFIQIIRMEARIRFCNQWEKEKWAANDWDVLRQMSKKVY